jgi:threonine/homoserine/homoserine lactone efflux protein
VGAVVGDLLPLAVGIAISPVPIIAVILMLLSRKATATSTAFLLGWVAGVVVVTVVVLALVGQAGDSSGGEPSTLSSVLKVVFGVLLLLMALRQWRSRPKAGEAGEMPKWMGAIESFTFGRALGLGFVLSGINPKNLLLCLGAGTTIGAAHLPAGQVVVAMTVFTVLASSTVAVPVVGYLAARDRMAAPLESLRAWLTQNNAGVMAVLLLVLGTALVGKGIGGL